MSMNPAIAFRSAFNDAAAKLKKVTYDLATDTSVLFAVGDLAVAAESAEKTGVMLNVGCSALAIAGRVSTTLTGRNIGLGFYAASGVSAYTTGSIIYRYIQQHPSSAMSSFNMASVGALLPAAAFGFWTVANLIAGYREATGTKAKGVLDNAQTYFCLGSAAVARANPVATVMFLTALAQSFRKERPDDAPVKDWKDFIDKHMTAKRLRALGYATVFASAAATMIVNPISAAVIFPVTYYALFMAGNVFFDKGKNATIMDDLRAVVNGTVAAPQKLALPKP